MNQTQTPTKTQHTTHAVGDTATLWTVTSFYPQNPPESAAYTLKPCYGGTALAWYGCNDQSHQSYQSYRFLPAHADGTPQSPYVFFSAAEATEWRITELTTRLRVAEAQLHGVLAERDRYVTQERP